MAVPGAFPPTRASLVRAASSAEPDVRRQAFGALAEGYWNPVYKYLRRRWGADRAEAADLTQGFFARAFEKMKAGRLAVEVHRWMVQKGILP
jgi:DNA-directed RNA polymerase specialized sigma24 family protein